MKKSKLSEKQLAQNLADEAFIEAVHANKMDDVILLLNNKDMLPSSPVVNEIFRIAVANEHTLLAHYLLEYDLELVNMRHNGLSPLHVAIDKKSVPMVALL
ncbi:MAG: hypothetical protein WBE18_04745, partial [Gammaproteobacteria bacterium]